MPQHVRMHLELKAGLDAKTLDHLGKAGGRKRRPALGYEYELAVQVFLPQPAKRPHYVTLERTSRRLAALDPADVHGRVRKINLRPTQIDETIVLSRSLGGADEAIDHRR
jgi:hypothetical protein